MLSLVEIKSCSNFINSKLKLILTVLVINSLIIGTSTIQASENNHGKKHTAGIFLGILDNDGTESVLGFEYEYRFNSMWGIGAVYEDASDAHHGDGISATTAVIYFHPMGAWRMGLGFGREKVGGAHPHTESLARVGVSYDFHIGGLGIAPSLNIDTVDGETATVYGVAFLISF